MPIESLVKKAFQNAFNVEYTEVTSALSFGDMLEWDSLGHISLMCELEKVSGISVPSSLFSELNSYEKIERYIHASKTNQGDIPIKNNNVIPFSTSHPKIHRGLKEIYYDTSNICLIDIEKGLFYRGYNINNIINDYSFEEISFLLITGKLPSPTELQEVTEIIFKNLRVDEKILEIEKKWDGLSLINLFKILISTETYKTETLKEYSDSIFSLLGKLVALIVFKQDKLGRSKTFSSYQSIAHNLAAAFYPKDIEFATSFFKKDLIIHAEHESNASTFTARIAASTRALLPNILTAAIDTFSGDLHGGALNKIDEQFDNLKKLSLGSIEHFVRNQWDQRKPIYGFGHRVYVGEDPRSVIYKELLASFEEKNVLDSSFQIARQLELSIRNVSNKNLNPNVDLYCSVAYRSLGIKREFHVALFVISRLIGWSAHIWEQYNNPIILRPRLHYTGEQFTTEVYENKLTS